MVNEITTPLKSVQNGPWINTSPTALIELKKKKKNYGSLSGIMGFWIRILSMAGNFRGAVLAT